MLVILSEKGKSYGALIKSSNDIEKCRYLRKLQLEVLFKNRDKHLSHHQKHNGITSCFLQDIILIYAYEK